jgi:hypothetical protein
MKRGNSMEKEVSVTPVGVLMCCSDCNSNMDFLGKKDFSKYLFLHKCKRCGKEQWLSKEYPYVKFELNNI